MVMRVDYREVKGGILELATEKEYGRVARMRAECASLTEELKGLAGVFDYLRRNGESATVLKAGGQRIASLEDRLAGILNELLRLREEIEDDLEGLSGAAREVLRMRYIEGMEWDAICETVSISRRAVFYLHSGALEQIARDREDKTGNSKC